VAAQLTIKSGTRQISRTEQGIVIITTGQFFAEYVQSDTCLTITNESHSDRNLPFLSNSGHLELQIISDTWVVDAASLSCLYFSTILNHAPLGRIYQHSRVNCLKVRTKLGIVDPKSILLGLTWVFRESFIKNMLIYVLLSSQTPQLDKLFARLSFQRVKNAVKRIYSQFFSCYTSLSNKEIALIQFSL
jgi:hypothetical protein